MNENLNLVEILKDCPEGTKLYSPLFGEVDFQKIRNDDEFAIVVTKDAITASFTKEGFYYVNLGDECILFPSKDQRDWSKFTAPWYKKDKFDPNTLKPLDRVLIKDAFSKCWYIGIFSHYIENDVYPYKCVGNDYKLCIPYNDDTKHLVGTTDEAPEYYRY